jgi:hypothetical protein
MMLATKVRRRQEAGSHLLFLLFFVAKNPYPLTTTP